MKTYTKKTDRAEYVASKPQELAVKFQPQFIKSMDQRTELCKALKARYVEICAELGGVDELSSIKRSMIERFVWMEARLSAMEVEIAVEEDGELVAKATARWTQLVNSYVGFCRALGLERVTRVKDLKSHLAYSNGTKRGTSTSTHWPNCFSKPMTKPDTNVNGSQTFPRWNSSDALRKCSWTTKKRNSQPAVFGSFLLPNPGSENEHSRSDSR